MAEQWIKNLVQDLKKVYSQAAQRSIDRQNAMEHYRSFWLSFGALVKKYLDEMAEEFGEDITYGAFTFRLEQPTGELKFSKTGVPGVECSATPDYGGEGFYISYTLLQQSPTKIPARFEILARKVTLHLSGDGYTSAEEAAKKLITTVFNPSAAAK